MTKASDNAYPSILITEGTEPTAPAAGKQRLYIDSTTHKLMLTNSSGTEHSVEPANTGSVATDTIWDAAGDLVVATGADAAARLAKGNAGGTLAMGNSAVIWNANTSFPASKATNDRYFRTDLLEEFVWDGTRWVGITPVRMELNLAVDQGISASAILHRSGLPPATELLIGGFYTYYNVLGGTALGASHKWVGTVSKTGGSTSTSMGTITIDSGASSQWLEAATLAINAVVTRATYNSLEISWVKTGTPGPLYAHVFMSYRVVAT